MAFWRVMETVKNLTASDNRAAERAQITNQKQATRSAGRGSRSVGGQGSTRTKPSRTF